MDLVCMDFLSLEMSAGGYEHILVITDHFTRYAQPSLHETKQPRPQPDSYLTLLFDIMGSLPASTVTKVAALKARLLRSCAPLPMWIRQELLLIILWARECQNVSTRLSLICLELWKRTRSRTGKLTYLLWYMHTTRLDTKAPVFRPIILCLGVIQDLQ